MGLSCCFRVVERLLQCLLSACRCCWRQLRQLVHLLLHMKAAAVFRHSGRTWRRLWAAEGTRQYSIRVLLVGKRFTGKTALLYRLKLGAFIPTRPSVGSNTETVEFHVAHHTRREDSSGQPVDVESAAAAACATTVRATFCDVPGGDGESLEWQGLQQGCDCVCFALDSTAPLNCVEDARREFLELFYDEHFVLRRSTPFVILATKQASSIAPLPPFCLCFLQDLHNARSTAEVRRLLELPEEVKETFLPQLRETSCNTSALCPMRAVADLLIQLPGCRLQRPVGSRPRASAAVVGCRCLRRAEIQQLLYVHLSQASEKRQQPRVD
ncbi:hypothetical protein Efla_006335 [Eimeria flavescens]